MSVIFSNGTVHKMNSGETLMVLDYIGCNSIDVVFLGTGYKANVTADRIRKGTVKDKLTPTYAGVGYLGAGHYIAAVKGKNTKAYDAWSGMIDRCYKSSVQLLNPTYIGCSVVDEWHDFSVYYKWFTDNYISGFDVDKDIKVSGNKVYGPEFCMFVSRGDNTEASSAKYKTLKSPLGSLTKVYNMNKFCRDNDLCRSGITRVLNKTRNSHKGWRLPTLEELNYA